LKQQDSTENWDASVGFGDGAVCTVTSSNPSCPLAAAAMTSTVAIMLSPSTGLWYGPYSSANNTTTSHLIKAHYIIVNSVTQ